MSGSPFEPPPSEAPIAPGYTLTVEKPRTGLAVGALVCGIVGVVTLGLAAPVGLVGLILGVVAAVRAKRNPARHAGRHLAIGAVCLGAISVVLVPVLLLPSLAAVREWDDAELCFDNFRNIRLALIMYQQDHSHALPVSLQTLLGSSYLPSLLKCRRSSVAGRTCDYYYVPLPPADAPLIKQAMTASSHWIVAYEDAANHPKYGANVLYLDGHKVRYNEPQLSQELARFKAEYEQVCGEPPQIIPPR